MKKSVVLSALALGVLVVSGVALAEGPFRGPMANVGNQPVFGPTGGGGQTCSSPGLAFGAAPASVNDTISIAGAAGAVSGLDVELQIAHTWVGDIVADIEHDGTTVLLLDRPGVPLMGACGCPNNDVDVVLSDAGGSPAENACSAAPPAIGGTLTPTQALSAFDGDDPNGDWTLTVSDGFPASDNGTLNTWCISIEGAGGTGGTTAGTGTPATTTWGLIALVAMFLGASLYFLRRRSSVNA